MGVYKGLVRFRNRGLLASTTFMVHCKEPEVGRKKKRGFPSGHTRWTYPGDVIRRLSEHLEDVDGRREILVLEVMQRFRVGPGILFLPHILHHLRLKLCVHRTRLDQGQPVEGRSTRSKTGGLVQQHALLFSPVGERVWLQQRSRDIKLEELHSQTLAETLHGKLGGCVHVVEHHS